MQTRLGRWIPTGILAAVSLVFAALVIATVRSQGTLIHDEIISHLAATGHLDDWQRVTAGGRPAGIWASGAELRHFLQLDGHSSLGAVDQNLRDLDIHPPLFFWALLGVRELGFDIIWSGPALNITIAVVAGGVLYRLLVRVLDDRLLAALAVGVFAFSDALVRTVANTRQYPLQMLAAVVLMWVLAQLLEHPSSVSLLIALSAVGALGLLTATQFAFALAGAVVAAAAWWGVRNLRATVYVAVAAVVGGLTALAIHSGYFDQYSRSQFQASFDPSSTPTARFHAWVDGLFDLVTLDHTAHSVFEAVALVGGLALVATIGGWYGPVVGLIRSQAVCVAAVGVAGVSLLGTTVAYLLHRSPAHAVGWQYLVLFWPGLVLLGAVLVQRNFRRPALTLLITAALLLTLTARWQHGYSNFYVTQRRAVKEVSSATLVIADCLERGSTPSAAMWVPADSKFLLLTRQETRPPPVPADADRSRAFLFHSDSCTPGNGIDQRLAKLGLERGRLIGPIGRINVYPLETRVRG